MRNQQVLVSVQSSTVIVAFFQKTVHSTHEYNIQLFERVIQREVQSSNHDDPSNLLLNNASCRSISQSLPTIVVEACACFSIIERVTSFLAKRMPKFLSIITHTRHKNLDRIKGDSLLHPCSQMRQLNTGRYWTRQTFPE